MTYSFEMYSAAKKHPDLADMTMVTETESNTLPFPLDKPYVSFGTEYENSGFLIGDQNGTLTSECMTVCVAVSDRYDAVYCRECAQVVSLVLMNLDKERRIISISSEKCEYIEEMACYSIKIRFGLSEARRNGGD